MSRKPQRNRKRVAAERRMPDVRHLFAPALVLVAGLALVAIAHLGYTWLDKPVRELVVQGSFQRTSAEDISAQVAPVAQGQGLLSLDLDAVRRAAEAPDWVDRVRVSRRWPDTLILEVNEQIAAARWSDGGLLNTRGERFDPADISGTAELPELGGPDGSQWQVIQRYLALRAELSGQQHRVTRMQVDARGAWSLVLDDRIEVQLGREETSARLARLQHVALITLASSIHAVARIDLRYTNGFAVAWRQADAGSVDG
jgi:cell division protein FtsQ